MNLISTKRAFVIFVFIAICILNIRISHARRAVPDDLIVHPVLVTLFDGSNATGSGFYLRHGEKGIFLVSAFHVFMETDKNKNIVIRSKKANLLSYPKDLDWSKPAKMEIDLEHMIESKFIRYDSVNDALAIQIAKEVRLGDGERTMKLNDGVKKLSDSRLLTVPVANIKRYKEVLIGNDVYISGFPSSLGIKKIPQIDYYKPLLRKGIVAGKFDERMTIIIDCPTFGGNSGGPVIELEKINIAKQNVRVIGIISQFVPFVEKWINPQHRLTNIEFENSGYSVVVPIDKVIELIEKF